MSSRDEKGNEEDKDTKNHRKHPRKIAKARRRGNTTDYRIPRSEWVYTTPKCRKKPKDGTSSSDESDCYETPPRVTPPLAPCPKSTVGACGLQPAIIQRDEMKIYVARSKEQDVSKYHCESLEDFIDRLCLQEYIEEMKEKGEKEMKKINISACDVGAKHVTIVDCVKPQLNGNYVGELNELVAKSSLPYPSYEPSCLTNGIFVVECRLGNETALGHGFTKKDAKQDAARNMLKHLNEGPTKLINKLGNFLPQSKQKVEVDDKSMKEIIDLYKRLSVGNISKSASSETDSLKPDSGVKIDTDSIEEIELMLDEFGISYTISDFSVEGAQHVVYLVINNSDMTLMGMGSTRKQAVLDVLKRTLVLKKLGCSFAFRTL